LNAAPREHIAPNTRVSDGPKNSGDDQSPSAAELATIKGVERAAEVEEKAGAAVGAVVGEGASEIDVDFVLVEAQRYKGPKLTYSAFESGEAPLPICEHTHVCWRYKSGPTPST
jgi:hypothetical protein